MESTPKTAQEMARDAFGLLLVLRDRDNAHLLLTHAITFLEILGREKDGNSAPVVLSVRVMPLRKS